MLVRYEDTATLTVGGRIIKVTGLVRIFPPGIEPPAPYMGAGSVLWRTQDECEIHALHTDKQMTFRHWRALAFVLSGVGATKIWAKRGPGKLLPLAQPGPDGWQFIDLTVLHPVNVGP